LGVEEAAKGLGVVDSVKKLESMEAAEDEDESPMGYEALLVVSGGRGASSLLFGVPKMLELFVSADFPKMLE
jgi:hypothetical protein